MFSINIPLCGQANFRKGWGGGGVPRPIICHRNDHSYEKNVN